jgi:hypothetical protein
MQKVSHILVSLILALLIVTIKNMAYSQTPSMEQSQTGQQAIDESEERSVEQPVVDSIEQELAVPEDTEVKKAKKMSIIPAYGDGPGEVVDKQLEGTGLTFFPDTRGNAIPDEIFEDKNKWQSSEPLDMGGP